MSYKLTILTPEGKAFEGTVESISVPGAEGGMGVYTGHVKMLSSLKAGIVKISVSQGYGSFFVITGGIAEVAAEGVTILADTAQPAASLIDASMRLEALLHQGEAPAPATPH